MTSFLPSAMTHTQSHTHNHTHTCASLFGPPSPQADGSKRRHSQTARSKSPAREGGGRAGRATPLTYIIINNGRLSRACDTSCAHTPALCGFPGNRAPPPRASALGDIMRGLLGSAAASMGFFCLQTEPAGAKQDWHKWGANNVGA